MTNQDLISKLNKLKSVAPEASWLESNRELLLSQVSNSGAIKLSVWKVFMINLQSVAKAASQPAIALGVFIFVLLGGSLFSHQVFSQTKPNDSLYIARIISEKMRLNTVLDYQERNKLAVQFASEHAQDISAVLADPSFNNEENQDQVAKLNDSFNKEVDTVKNRIAKMTPKAAPKASLNPDEPVSSDDALITIADSAKDDQGIQISLGVEIEANLGTSSSDSITVAATSSASSSNELDDSVAGSASSSNSNTESSPESPVAVDASKILDEAKEFFNNKDYNSALNKLKEVDQIVK